MMLVEVGTDLTALEPSIAVSEGATIDPSGVQNFSDNVIYTVISEDGVSIKEWTATIEERPLGIDDVQIEVFPNPTEDMIYISGGERFYFNVVDMTGRTLMSGNAASEISLKELPIGTYTLLLKKDLIRIDKRIIKH